VGKKDGPEIEAEGHTGSLIKNFPTLSGEAERPILACSP